MQLWLSNLCLKTTGINEVSFACSEQQSLPLGRLGQFRPRAHNIPVAAGLRFVRLCVLRLGQIGSEEFVQLFSVISYLCFLAFWHNVVFSHFLIGCSVLEDVVYDLKHLCCNRDQCAFLSPSGCEFLVPGGEECSLCPDCTPRTFCHDSLSGLVAVVGVRTFFCPRFHCCRGPGQPRT